MTISHCNIPISKNIDIAIVKATNHEECPPKDIHVKSKFFSSQFFWNIL